MKISNLCRRVLFAFTTSVLLGVGIASAAPTSGSNLPGGSPLVIAFTGNKLTLATQGPQDMVFKTNDITRMTINGTTGAVSGLTLTSPILNNASYTGTFTQDLTAGGNLLITRLGASSAGSFAMFGGGGSTLDADITGTQIPSLLISQQPSAGNLDWSGEVGRGATANGPRWDFLKTRSTSNTLDANTIVNSADQLANIRFFGADGIGYAQAAAIIVTVDGTPSGGGADMPGAFDFQVSPDGSATPASALKLTNDKAATFAGAIKSTATNVGWTIRSGANTACNTTCTAAHGCLFGQDTGSANIAVDCANATADVCVCSF